MKNNLDACVAYFQDKEGFQRLFKLMAEKYKRLGRIGGVVHINSVTHEEREALGGLLLEEYGDEARISLIKVDKALEKTIYKGIKLENILKAYFHDELLAYRILEEQDQDAFDAYISQLILDSNQIYASWLEQQRSDHTRFYQRLKSFYLDSYQAAHDMLGQLGDLINHLPYQLDKQIYISQYAATHLRDPHGLDVGKPLHKHLLRYISDILKVPYPKSAWEKSHMFYQVGLLKDGISNYATVYHLLAYRNGKVKQAWKGYVEEQEAHLVTWKNLGQVDEVRCQKDNVIVIENPTVFAMLVDRYPVASFICSNGQINYGTYLLLDKMKEGTTIYYCGDFDPEGLRIADKIIAKYNAIPLGYKKSYFIEGISENTLTESRINQLNALQDVTLRQMASEIRKVKKATYQENIIERIMQEVKMVIEN